MSATRRRRSKRNASRRKRGLPDWAKTFGDAHPAIRDDLAASERLPEFLAKVTPLTKNQKLRIVEQARIMLRQVYVHLPLKEAMHAVEPIQRLRLLEHRLDQLAADTQFHRELTDVFVSLRDLHTIYVLPSSYHGRAAYLPFLVEEYFEKPGGEPHYLVSHWIDPFTHTSFTKGSEVRFWNGVPIRRAVEVNAARHGGSNTEARRARGLDSLTIRSLATSLPPDEHWVTVEYRTPSGQDREIRFEWLVAPFSEVKIRPAGPPGNEGAMALDIEGDLIREIKRTLFAPETLVETKTLEVSDDTFPSLYAETFTARKVATEHGTFGHLRIRSFGERPPSHFVPEVMRLLEQMPKDGLIIDVRDNGGGYVWNAEMLLQFFTPHEIQPEPTQFINSAETLALSKEHEDLAPWHESIKQSLETGAVYSKAIPLTPPELCNMFGQLYHGPVVLITNAKCYSATDLFAAGFCDHDIGKILGADERTGAGGANVWQHRAHLIDVYQRPGSPFLALPKGADMTVSIRRTLRVGEQSGTPVEDLGVQPHARHFMTRRDLLEGNVDLLAAAGAILAKSTKRVLDVDVSGDADDVLELTVTTENVSSLDFFVDGRPHRNDVRTTDGTHTVQLTGVADGATTIDVKGYYRNKLVAARKLSLE